MKRVALILLTLTLLSSFAACGQKKQYTDSLATHDLADRVIAAIGNTEDYSTAENGFLDDFFQTPDYVTDFEIRFASETDNLNEIGIYHVSEGNAKAMADHLEKYLTESLRINQSWFDSYIPDQTPKLRDAQVRIFGNYVAYAILSKSDRATAWDTLEAALSKN